MGRIDIGIDAGGTTTRLEVHAESGERLAAQGDGSNPRVIGTHECIRSLTELIHEACGDRLSGAAVFLCAGVAGASTDDVQDQIAAGLGDALADAASRSIQVTDDATTSFEAAFAGAPGTLLLLGTGSNIICKTFDGEWIHSGGWGYLIGDEGSGYAIGRLGLRAVARAMDRGHATALRERATADFGLDARDRFLAAIYGGTLRFADFAHVVLEEASRGDIESRLLVSEAVGMLIDDLAATVENVASELPRMIRVVGGLANSTVYMREVTAGISVRLGEDWQIAPSERTPVEGALWIASQMAD